MITTETERERDKEKVTGHQRVSLPYERLSNIYFILGIYRIKYTDVAILQ